MTSNIYERSLFEKGLHVVRATADLVHTYKIFWTTDMFLNAKTLVKFALQIFYAQLCPANLPIVSHILKSSLQLIFTTLASSNPSFFICMKAMRQQTVLTKKYAETSSCWGIHCPHHATIHYSKVTRKMCTIKWAGGDFTYNHGKCWCRLLTSTKVSLFQLQVHNVCLNIKIKNGIRITLFFRLSIFSFFQTFSDLGLGSKNNRCVTHRLHMVMREMFYGFIPNHDPFQINKPVAVALKFKKLSLGLQEKVPLLFATPSTIRYKRNSLIHGL